MKIISGCMKKDYILLTFIFIKKGGCENTAPCGPVEPLLHQSLFLLTNPTIITAMMVRAIIASTGS